MSTAGTESDRERVDLEDVIASLSPVCEPEDADDHLAVVKAAQEIEAEARRLLQRTVLTARGAGATWAGVGEALGISKQAAQKRFAAPKAPSGRTLDPDERFLGPVGMLDEMEELNLAGRYGWHSVDFGVSHHRVVRSGTQWEHRRVAGARKVAALEAEGWVLVGRSFPYALLKKDSGAPALDEVEPG